VNEHVEDYSLLTIEADDLASVLRNPLNPWAQREAGAAELAHVAAGNLREQGLASDLVRFALQHDGLSVPVGA
jgi:hypothetical protein